jgi:hypothetical protein
MGTAPFPCVKALLLSRFGIAKIATNKSILQIFFKKYFTRYLYTVL